MASSDLKYRLNNGYVDHWLTAGPLVLPVEELDRHQGPDYKLSISRTFFDSESGVVDTPAEQAQLEAGGSHGRTERLTWRVYECNVDHLVDLSDFYHTCHYLRSWAYAQLNVEETQEITFELTTNGPADVWLNGDHIHRHEEFHHQIPQRKRFRGSLSRGQNEVLVRFEAVAVRECPYSMALQLIAVGSDKIAVHLPTTLAPISRRQRLSELMEKAYLERDVYAHKDQLRLLWPNNVRSGERLVIRLQTPTGRIYAEANPLVGAGSEVKFGAVEQYPDGEFEMLLMPEPEEYYNRGMRVVRRIPLRISKNQYTQAPYATAAERRLEALDDAGRRRVNVFAEIAKMELGRWSQVKKETILQTIDRINRRSDCSDFYLVGLLGMALRYGHSAEFPKELQIPLENCILGFKYWMDEPGEDAMCYWSENHQILFHTCEVLAGQIYPDRVFPNVKRDGYWHREKGERMALSWLQKRARSGFREWDSNCYFEEDILALAHLADLAEETEVAEMAAVVLDKLLFTMAVNSYQGVFGSTHGRTYAPLIRGGRFEPTSGIGRLLWGQGVFNDRIMGTVSLACASGYEMPDIIAAIALDRRDELWNREQHAGELEEWCDRETGRWAVNKVTYRTPDYMLASAQDYHPGEAGYQQHIWQATLGADAVVFVSHPACASEDNSRRPNFWHGNAVLPRVVQWKDVLIAVHNLPDDDWMGFTHAYFPRWAFDEYRIEDEWLFARKGNGYLALTAAGGIAQVGEGYSANHELRSHGLHNIWVCQMGRAALDGSFEDFVQSIHGNRLEFGDLAVHYQSLRGDRLHFGWAESLTVNGVREEISGFKHYENPYCTAELPAPDMVIEYLGNTMRLVF